jgi:hypothetical protein
MQGRPWLLGFEHQREAMVRSLGGGWGVQVVREHGCQSVVDFGCGEGAWIKALMLEPERNVTSVLGVDELPLAMQRGSKLIPAVQLKCKKQPELQGKPLPAVKLCQVRFPP